MRDGRVGTHTAPCCACRHAPAVCDPHAAARRVAPKAATELTRRGTCLLHELALAAVRQDAIAWMNSSVHAVAPLPAKPPAQPTRLSDHVTRHSFSRETRR